MADLVASLRDAPALPLAARVPRLRISVDALSMAGLAVVAGILYLVNLTVSGYANTYYAMAAQAAGQSWSALFFGALDSHGFITIDKPPLATALMGLSVRLFGLSPASVLLPEALLGIGTVLVLFLAVRRSFGSRAGLIAGLAMAVMPVSVLIYRYDNPDALMTFLLVSGAWAVGRGLEHGRARWAAFAAFLVGLAFLTKYLQAWMVLPAFAVAWLVSAPGSVRRRVAGLLVSAGVVAMSSLWWVAAVELIPAGSRPFIGGSPTNSALDLLLGYDGLGRLFGNAPAGSGLGNNAGVGPGGAFGGAAGLLRMFNDGFGGQIAWLLPAAFLSILAAVVIHRRSARTDRRVAGYVLWTTWLLVHVVVFSFMSGIVHPYYTVIVVPAIAALVAAASVELWDRRATSPAAGLALAAGLVGTGITAWALLERTPAFAPGLGIGVLAVSIAAAIVISIPAGLVGPLATRAALALALAAVLAAPLAYASDTMQTALSGGDPQPGPMAQSNGGPGNPGGTGAPGGADVSQALVDYLVENQGSARWIVAANGSMVAASIQLAAGQPVMTMGGFTGGDPTPSLDQLQSTIASGELRYVLVSGNTGPGGPGPGIFGHGSSLGSWVARSCAAVTIDGVSTGLYDCSGAGS